MDKKKQILKPLLAYAGKRKVLTYLSMVTSALSQLLALVPFLYIWAILKDVLAGDYSRIAHYGWMAVADKIVVLNGGKVEECGTPAQLTASGGFYKRMRDIQQGALEWNI